MNIVLATRNKKKVEEIKRILKIPNIKILTLDDFPDSPEVVEDMDTFEGNALKKAIAVSKFTGLASVADDSGLEVDALSGAPGVHSAYYAGDNAKDSDNIAKLLIEIQHVPEEKRTARFVCCIAIAFPDGTKKVFFGYVYGKIGKIPKGSGGFGYDPIFYPEKSALTFAEMSPSEKDNISHRKEALSKLKEYLQNLVGYNT